MPVTSLAPAVGAGPTSTTRAAPAPGRTFASALETHLDAATRPSAAAAAPTHPAAAALRAVEAAQARLDGVLAAARSGRTFTAGELLGLQAEAYRLSQTLDLAGKLVEHGVQAAKQAVQTQV